MKITKFILKIIAVLLALPLLIALFVKKSYQVQREVIIDKSLDSVYNYVKYLKNQDHFSKWAQMDKAMKKTFRGTDATSGFVSAWESKSDDVGAGEQEILKMEPNQRIDYELRFLKPFKKSISKAFLCTQAMDTTHTKVIWGFEGNMSYPMNLMLLAMNFEEMIGADLQQGLNNLKELMDF